MGAAVLEKVAAGKGVTSTEITKSPQEIEQDEAQRKEKARNASRSTVVNICAAIALTFARAFPVSHTLTNHPDNLRCCALEPSVA